MLAVALVLRVGLVAATTEYVPSGDPIDYDAHAVYLVDHHSYPPSAQAALGSPAGFRPPAWPYLLAGVYKATGARWTAGRLAGAGLGTLTVLLVFLMATEALGAGVGRVAGWLAAVFPPMVLLSGSLVAENLFVPLAVAAAWATLRARRSSRPLPWAVMAGAMCGLAALTRTNGLVLVAPVAIGLVGQWKPSALRPRALVPAGVAVLAAIAVIAPWTARNAHAFGAFVPLSTQSGYTEAAVWNPQSNTPGPDYGRPQYGTLAPYLRRPGTDEVDLDRTLGRKARRYARAHPGYVLNLVRLNLERTFKLASSKGTFAFYWNRERDMTRPRRVLDSIGLALVVALALVALAWPAARRRLGGAPWWLWLFPALNLASTVVLLGNPRYRAPIDPYLVIVAAVALCEGARRLPGRHTGP